MATSGLGLLKSQYNIRQAMGTDAINSDSILVIDGYENMYIKIKSFPDPSSLIEQPIEVPMPLGNKINIPGQRRTWFTGPVAFIETEERAVGNMLREIVDNGAYFDCWLYQGTPDHFVNRKRLIGCWFAFPSDLSRDFSNNTEVLTVEGDMYGNYFGEMEEGTVKSLIGA